MALQEAIYKAIQEFGKDVLIESRFINILNDYHGFDEMPAAMLILRIIQEEGHMSQLVSSAESLNKQAISQIPYRITNAAE